MLRVIGVHDTHENAYKEVAVKRYYDSLEELQNSVNNFLPDFTVNPSLKAFAFKVERMESSIPFAPYEHTNVDTGDAHTYQFGQIKLKLELEHGVFSIGKGGYEVLIDVICDSEEFAEKINLAMRAIESEQAERDFNEATQQIKEMDLFKEQLDELGVTA